MVTTEDVKKLRDETGISVMQCKKALEEADGDIAKAKIILQKKGSAIAEKKADRALCAGTVAAYVHNTKDVGAMAVLSCETDFVAKNNEFVALARDIAMHIAAQNPAFLDREAAGPDASEDAILTEQTFIKDSEKSIKDLINDATQKFGEKIAVTNFVRFSTRG